MRLMLFFDLPVETAENRRDYRHFVKFLEKDGYIRLQESVFAKLAIDDHVSEASINRLERNRPPVGLIQVLKITEKQFAAMRTIVGTEYGGCELTDTNELIIL